MKIGTKIVLMVLATMFLSSCVVFEKMRLQLNFVDNTGEIQFFNIVSAISKDDEDWQNESERIAFLEKLKEVRKKDQNELLDQYVNHSEEWVISKELVQKGKKLNGIEKFKIKCLKEYKIERSEDGTKYIMKIGNSMEYLEGNGTYKEDDKGKYITWPIDVKKIDVTFKPYDFNDFDHIESMLPFWKEWKKTH